MVLRNLAILIGNEGTLGLELSQNYKEKASLKKHVLIFSLQKESAFEGDTFKLPTPFQCFFPSKVEKKRSLGKQVYIIRLYSVDFLLPSRAKIFAGLVKN